MLTALGLLGMLALGPGDTAPASPGAEGAAVMPVQTKGALPKHRRAELERTIVKGLRLGRFDVVEPQRVAEALLKDCKDPRCLIELAEAVKARYLVRATIEVRQSDIDFHLELIDGKSGEPIAQAKETCEICSNHEAETTARGLGASLGRTLEARMRSDPQLTVTSAPRGAKVFIDGQYVGTTPVQLPQKPGAHEVEVFAPSRLPQTRTVEMVAGVEQELTLKLERADEPATRVPGWAGWATIAAGVGAAGAGAALWSIHDDPILSDCDGENIDDDGDCKYRYNTLAGGVTLVVAGGLAVAGGIALVVIHRRQRRRGQARIRPDAGGLTIAF